MLWLQAIKVIGYIREFSEHQHSHILWSSSHDKMRIHDSLFFVACLLCFYIWDMCMICNIWNMHTHPPVSFEILSHKDCHSNSNAGSAYEAVCLQVWPDPACMEESLTFIITNIDFCLLHMLVHERLWWTGNKAPLSAVLLLHLYRYCITQMCINIIIH